MNKGMFYKLLGMGVWHGGKFALRRRYGSTYVPKPVLAGAAATAIGVIALVFALRRNGSGD
jgi:hypothetical protein